MDVNTLKQILELGWPAIITVFFAVLAQSYIADQRKQIATLWERVTSLETELLQVKKQLLDAHLNGDK